MMKKKAFAKLNLSLDVIEQTSSGYHTMEMIMVPIDLFDTVELRTSSKMSLKTNKGFLPTDKNNTIIKAIELLRERYNFQENFSIKLQKNIPTQAGLGGGSSDAAIVLKMINEKLNLGASDQDLQEIGLEVGADVPFCLFGKPAYARGFGEKLIPISIDMDFYLFIVKPKKGISTPQSFKMLDITACQHPDTKAALDAIEENDYQMLINNIDNSLEFSAKLLAPEIMVLKQELLEFGFDRAVMSGAGSTVFGITQDESLVNKAVEHFVYRYPFVKKTSIINDVRKKEAL